MSPRSRAGRAGSAWQPILLPEAFFRLDWLVNVLVRLNPSEAGWPEADGRLLDMLASEHTDASMSIAQPFILYVGYLQLSAGPQDRTGSRRGLRGAELVEALGYVREVEPVLFRGLLVALAQRVALHHVLWGAHGDLEGALCLEVRATAGGDPASRHVFRFVIDVPSIIERAVSDDERWDIDQADWRFLLSAAGWTPGPRAEQPAPPGPADLVERHGLRACGSDAAARAIVGALCTAAQAPTPDDHDLASPRLRCDERTFGETIGRCALHPLDVASPSRTVPIRLAEARERAMAILSQEARHVEESRRFFNGLAGPEWTARIDDLWRQRAPNGGDLGGRRWYRAIEQGGAQFHVKLMEDNPVLRPLCDAERRAQDALRRLLVDHPRVRVSRNTIGRATLPFVPAARMLTAIGDDGLPVFHAFLYPYLGSTWREFVNEDGHLCASAPPELARAALHQLAERLFDALEALHRDVRIVHGDIWTSNVRVWRQDGVLMLALVDFDQSMTIGLNPPLGVTNRRRAALQPPLEELDRARRRAGGREVAMGATPWFDVHVAARMVLDELARRPFLAAPGLQRVLHAACDGRRALTAGEVVALLRQLPLGAPGSDDEVAPVVAVAMAQGVPAPLVVSAVEVPQRPTSTRPQASPLPAVVAAEPPVEPAGWERAGVYGLLCALALLPIGLGLFVIAVVNGGVSAPSVAMGAAEQTDIVTDPLLDTGVAVEVDPPAGAAPVAPPVAAPVAAPSKRPRPATRSPAAAVPAVVRPPVSKLEYSSWLQGSRRAPSPLGSGAMTNVSASQAEKYCKSWGGIAAANASPKAWNAAQGTGYAEAEWRTGADKRPVILSASGTVDVSPDPSQASPEVGFRCAGTRRGAP